MTANRQSGSIHHGMYIKIARLAEIIGASPVDIVAAAKVCGHQVVPGMIWFQKEVTTEFVEEVWLIQKMNASAAARRQAHETQTLNSNSPSPPSDRRQQAAGV